MADQNSNNNPWFLLPVLISSTLSIIAIIAGDYERAVLVEDFFEYHLAEKQTIRILSKEFCLGSSEFDTSKPKSSSNVVVLNCNESNLNQQFVHMSDGTIRTDPRHCLDFRSNSARITGAEIVVWDCNGYHPNQEFNHQKFNYKESDRTIRIDLRHCLAPKSNGVEIIGAEIVVMDCDRYPNQEFYFEDL